MTVPGVIARHFKSRVVIGIERSLGFYDQFDSGVQPTGISYIKGVDARKCPPPPWWTELPGMWGCNESHKAAIARALSDDVDNILIMEDDCRFHPVAAEQIEAFMAEVPSDWDALMFGGQVSVHDGKTIPVTSRVSRCIQVERLHCYALSRKGMITFYHALCEPGSCLPNDYRFGDLQEQGKLITYRIEPFVAYQADGESGISGRVEPARVWDDRVDVRVRSPESVRIISLVCPFSVLDSLRRRGIVTNGGETPPQFATLEPGRVEAGERAIANLMLDRSASASEAFRKYVDWMRSDACFHRTAVLSLWHPEKVIPYPGAMIVKAQTEGEVIGRITQA